MVLHHACFHIRKSADRSLFAAPRGLSQLVTSFIGSWCQGIHLMLLFAWTSCRPFGRLVLTLHSLELLEFLKHWLFRSKKAFILFALSTFRWNCFTLDWKDLFLVASISWHDLSLCPLYLFFLLFFALFDFQWPQNRLGFVWCFRIWLAQVDSNHRPRAYQARALTCWAMRQ